MTLNMYLFTGRDTIKSLQKTGFYTVNNPVDTSNKMLENLIKLFTLKYNKTIERISGVSNIPIVFSRNSL